MSTGTLDDARTRRPRERAAADRAGTGATATRTRPTASTRTSAPVPAARAATRTGRATRTTRTRAVRQRTDDPRAGGTAPFVLLIMVLLTSGLVATLWLSTAAAADSYRLDSARQVARDLSEQTERLNRDVESAQSAPAIAAAAQRQGLVPGGVPAVLLVGPDGSTRVVGDPRPARAAAPGPIAGRAAPPAPAAPRPAPRPVADPEVVAQTGTGPTTGATTGATTGDDQLAAATPTR